MPVSVAVSTTVWSVVTDVGATWVVNPGAGAIPLTLMESS